MIKINSSKNVIFLYPEITPYFIGCINNFSNNFPKIKLHIVYDSIFKTVIVNKNANYTLTQKNKFSLKQHLYDYCFSLNPDLILISGRMYKDYLYVAKKIKKICKTVTVQDSIYTNSIKQFIIRIFSFFLYKRYFDKFWGVGHLQRKFALDIGYDNENIYDGFYVADKIFFDSSKKHKFYGKKITFLFIGRLVDEKNILRFVEAIDIINKKDNLEHKINIIGSGYLKDKLLQFKFVNYRGLLNQKEIINIANKSDVFCLPSKFEPWGVVTHEMTALGLPVLISKNCGSIDLVKSGKNGFVFDPLDYNSMITAIRKFILLPKAEKMQFSLNSIKISKTINHDLWNKTLHSLIVTK